MFLSIREEVQKRTELANTCNDYILNALINKRNKKAVFSQLFLEINSIPLKYNEFLEHQNVIDFNHVKIIKQKDDYIILKLNKSGISYYNNHSKLYNVKYINIKNIITLYVLSLKKINLSLLFKSANTKINNAMESGIAKLIIFIITILSFLFISDVKDLFIELFN